MKYRIKLMTLLLLCAFFAPINANADNLCPEVTSEQMEKSIKVIKAFEAYHAFYMTYSDKDGEHTIQVNYNERELYENLVGETVMMLYHEVQYFDEHDGKCTQTIRVVSLNK